VRHGAGYAFHRLVPRRGATPVQRPVALRRLLEDLGPTFIKLGQVLSTRPDLVPANFEAELTRLQDNAPPVDVSTILAIVDQELGGLAVQFASFEHVPIAAASIGQVHGAVLPDGSEVVVKVRRPHIAEAVERDLALLNRAARAVSHRWSPWRRHDFRGFVEEFGTTLRRELDYLTEGRSADMARSQLKVQGIHVPSIDWTRTTVAVLTMERIRGVKIDDVGALDAWHIDRPDLARRFTDMYLSMVFDNGFFHADPHPGNVFVEHDGRLAMVDFGMMGTVTAAIRGTLTQLLMAVVSRDADALATSVMGLGVATGPIDYNSFRHDLDEVVGGVVDTPLRDVHIGPLLRDILNVERQHSLRLPRELALLVKTVLMCEGVAAHIDPQFQLLPALLPRLARPPVT